jgi:translation initiation factor IF-3
MPTEDALRMARSVGLDLVEVAPNADPPVCRLVNYGKFRYEMAKQEKDRKHNSASKIKEVKFRVHTDQHDYLTKLRRCEEFLDKGNKLKLVLQFRGRESVHTELGMERMLKIKEDLSSMGHVDSEPRFVGRTLHMVMSPLPANRRKRKFAPLRDSELEELEEDEKKKPAADKKVEE